MNIYLLPLLAMALRYLVSGLFCVPWTFFDPVCCCVIVYAFFHSMDTKDFVLFALYGGLVRDALSLDAFGLYMMAYLATAFAAAAIALFINRQNWIFVFPVVFLATLLSQHILFFLRIWSDPGSPVPYSWGFLGRSFVEAAGTTLFVYPLYRFSRRCALTLTA